MQRFIFNFLNNCCYTNKSNTLPLLSFINWIWKARHSDFHMASTIYPIQILDCRSPAREQPLLLATLYLLIFIMIMIIFIMITIVLLQDLNTNCHIYLCALFFLFIFQSPQCKLYENRGLAFPVWDEVTIEQWTHIP